MNHEVLLTLFYTVTLLSKLLFDVFKSAFNIVLALICKNYHCNLTFNSLVLDAMFAIS